ncbi:type IV secretion system protein [Kribbella sp. NPDC026611]|uniref:type IV secretion system protein n=1 Tax=Kribbella sp. NPDC026611 TaxID=3154911 RepID=UPI0033E70476
MEVINSVMQAALGGFFKLIFNAIAAVVVAAVEAVLKAVGFLWIYIKTPDVSTNGTVTFIQTHTSFIVVFVAAIAIIIGAVQMAVSYRGEPAREMLRSLLTLTVVSGGSATFAAVLIQSSDEFSSWIIGQALGANDDAFAKSLATLMVEPLKSPTETLGFVLVIFVGILMVITAIIQLALMIVRYGMLVLLVAMLPLTAAATNTEMGMSWFKRALGWLAGFIIYKPVAALIYAAAIHLMSVPKPAGGTAPDGTPETLKIIMGVTMMIVAVVALPAILRFVAPKAS